MKVLVLEPNLNGHRGPYLQWMVNGLLDHGLDVTVITLPESIAHPSMHALVRGTENDQCKRLRLIGSAAPVSLGPRNLGVARLSVRQVAYWRVFKRWYEAHVETVRPDAVFLPSADCCFYALALLGSPFGMCPWSGLVMRPSFHYRQMGVLAPPVSFALIKKLLFFRLLRNRYLKNLLTIDEPLVYYLKKSRVESVGKVVFLPEPAEFAHLTDAADAKQQLGLRTERNLILVYGSIVKRKGVYELLQALADPAFPGSADVLLAGIISPDIHAALAAPELAALISKERITLLDRFIETAEEPLLFAAADIVWLGYRAHYTASGVLIQAASAGCPVLACKEGIIGWQTKRHGLGRVVTPTDKNAVISAIRALIAEPPPSHPDHRHDDAFVRGNTLASAQETLAQAVASL